MSATTKPTDPAPPGDDAKPRGRIVKDPFAVAVSDVCERFNDLPPEERELLRQIVNVRFSPKPNVGA